MPSLAYTSTVLFPHDPECPLHVYVCNVSSFKEHLGSIRGKASKSKLKNTNFNFPMTKVTFFSIFLMHVQKEDFWI